LIVSYRAFGATGHWRKAGNQPATNKMKLDKDTYLLSLDLFIRRATMPTFKPEQLGQLATEAIRQSVAFHNQWDAMLQQVKTASTQAVESAKPTPPVQPLPRKGDNARQTIAKAPPKPLRAKVSAKRAKAPVKPLRAKLAKSKRKAKR
jgi:hypothetical protein